MRGRSCARIASRVSDGRESLVVHSTGWPDLAAQPAAGIANCGLSAGATSTAPVGSPAAELCSRSMPRASEAELAPSTSVIRRFSGSAASPIRITCASSTSSAPDGASSSSASALAAGSSSPSESSTAARSGRAISCAAEIAARQSPRSTIATTRGLLSSVRAG